MHDLSPNRPVYVLAMSSRFARPRDNDDDRGMDENYEARVNAARFNDNLDVRFGYNKHTEMTEKVGWMVNMQPAEVIDEEKRLVSAMDYYFIQGSVIRKSCKLQLESQLLKCLIFINNLKIITINVLYA